MLSPTVAIVLIILITVAALVADSYAMKHPEKPAWVDKSMLILLPLAGVLSVLMVKNNQQ